MRKGLAAVFLAALMATLAAAQVTTWEIDSAHSGAHFSVKHMMVSTVRGDFGSLKGSIQIDEADISRSSVEAVIDATTINTRVARRDEHLRSADFFDVANHPTITFRSKRVARSGGGGLQVVGDLTIRGNTREVALDVEGPTPPIKDQRGNARLGATATTRINRKEFGLTWNRALEAGGLTVGDQVLITIDIEAINRTAAPAPAAKKQ